MATAPHVASEVAPVPDGGTRVSAGILLHALAFVAGFSLIFIVGWGGAATAFGVVFGAYKSVLGRIGGVVVILFGLMTADVLRVPWLLRDTRRLQRPRSHSLVNSGVFGILFAAGWSPCIGVTLGAILTLGLSQESTGQAMVLASGYALGLSLPFLLLAVMLDRALEVVGRFRRHLRTLQLLSGGFLVLVGVLMLANRLTLIAIWAQRNGFYLDLAPVSSTPTYVIAIAAGLLSFLSPCVLPLVPAYLGYLSGGRFSPSAVAAPEPATIVRP
jgi:cytochrome c-type biogenesis protein